MIFTPEAEAVRAFFREVLGFAAVDAGGGWPIFALPPAELGIHPIDGAETGRHELYLMCDDLDATVAQLASRGVQFPRPIQDQGFGRVTWLSLAGGTEIALYQPRHPTAIQLDSR